MIRRNDEQGFSIIEVVILLVILGVIGIVGWFAYQSQYKTATTKTSPSANSQAEADQKTAPEPVLKNGSIDGEISFEYPANWELKQASTPTYRSDDPNDTTYSQETTQVTTVTSPDGNTVIKIQGGIGGIGGFCIPEDTGTITEINKATLPYDSQNKFVSYRTSEGETFFGLTSAASLDDTEVGSSACNLVFSGALEHYHRGIAAINFTYKPFVDSAGADSAQRVSEADFNAYVQSSDYKTALTILQSIKK